jgi:hypothetical protein
MAINFTKAFKQLLSLFGVRFKARPSVVEPEPPAPMVETPPPAPDGPPPPPAIPTEGLRGQFVIDSPGVRYGPGRDLIFLTEIDTIWRSSEAEAAKVLDRPCGEDRLSPRLPRHRLAFKPRWL